MPFNFLKSKKSKDSERSEFSENRDIPKVQPSYRNQKPPDKNGKINNQEDDPHFQNLPKLDDKALYGFAGRFVEIATQNSEADPAAVLTTFLTRFGVECGPDIYFMVGDSRHSTRIFSVIVGSSSKARKGTSGKPVERLFKFDKGLYPDYDAARTTPGPLSSGEGIIYAVRDSVYEWNQRKQENEMKDPGVPDKRLFVMDEEFGSALACTKREGNILSTIIRNAWDSGTLAPITKTNPIKATGAHVGICTHITMPELRQKMNDVEAFNGFANRFVWCFSTRPKLVPFPKPIPDDEFKRLQDELVPILEHANFEVDEMTLSDAAREKWETVYAKLTKDHSGLSGAVINRGEALVLRIAMHYALLDKTDTIQPEHLEAALALWRYYESSAKFIFGDRETDPHSRKILEGLLEGQKSRSQLYDLFGRRIKSADLDRSIRELIAGGKIESDTVQGNGRKQTIFRLIDGQRCLSMENDFPMSN